MKYFRFNTRKHVKIWLGPLNQQNKLRLRNLRILNPDSELTFIYDSRLVTSDELLQIQTLCKELNITALDVLTNIIPKCKTEEELNLVADYQESIQPEEQGGNLAAASDILRWLSPVYKLGTYSDLDVLIETRGLPKIVSVEKPLLFNLGSLQVLGSEFPAVNNDVLAIVDSTEALPLVKKVQQAIHNGCKRHGPNQSGFSHFMDSFKAKDNHQDSSVLGRLLAGSIALDPQLLGIAENKTAAETRAEVQRINSNNTNYFEWLCQHNTFNCLFLRTSSWFTDSLVDNARSANNMAKLLASVVYTTGPGVLLLAMTEHPNYPAQSFTDTLVPFSFEHYNLHRHFETGNRLPLHSDYFCLFRLDWTQRNDLSWLAVGQEKIKQLEAGMFEPHPLNKLKYFELQNQFHMVNAM